VGGVLVSLSEFAALTVCPWCLRTKSLVRQLAGPRVAPPAADGESFIICDVCGSVYAYEPAGGRALTEKERVAYEADIPAALKVQRDAIRVRRFGHTVRAVRAALRMRSERGWPSAEVAAMTGEEIGHAASPLEARFALERLKGLGEVDLVDDELGVPCLWRWAGGA
jgi:hypothetical protein